MKRKTKFMSMLLSALMISSWFSSLVVKATGAGVDVGPTPVGQATIANGVTSQEYEIKIPYYDDNVTDHHYELGSKDTQTVLSRVPNSITRTIQGKQVTLYDNDPKSKVPYNIDFNDDTNRDFPKKVSHRLTINCGVMDYALYQYKKGGYLINAAEFKKNFKEIPMSAVDAAIIPGGDCNSNEMLVWRGDYSSKGHPIFAGEPYQLFYPPINGSSSQAQLRREPYDVTSDLTVNSTSITQGLSYQDQPIIMDLPQGQSINPSQSYDFYAICSKDLSFTYNATDGTNTYSHTSYTTLSNPMILSDLQYFYPDYKEPSPYFFMNNLCSVKGSAFKDAGTVTRTNISGSTQTVHRYTTKFTFGYIEPSAVYTYTSLDHLYVPTVTYKGIWKSDGGKVDPTPTPDPTPVQQTGTVIKRYFLDGEEQTKDEEKETNVSVGTHSYSVDKQYPRHICSNPTVSVDVTADNTTYCDFNFEFQNHPPTVTLQGPSMVVMGDDFSVYASGVDPDVDPLTYTWNTPSDLNGSATGYTASGYFDSTGDKTFSVTVTDPYNASDSDSKVVKVVPPIPNVVIDKSGTEKENRKVTLNAEKYSSSGSKGRYPLDWNKAKWQFFDGSGKELTVDNNAISSTIVKSLDSTTGSKNIDLIFKKAGRYTAKCTLYNTAGYSNSFSVDLNIAPDLAPIADFNFPDGNNGYRDGKDLSPNGLAQGIDKLVDSSKLNDGDNIGKRMWIACFDSDNDGNFIDITKNEDGTKKAVPEKERWYLYDLDYNGDSDTRYKVQVPDNTPLNGKLVTVGSDGHKYAYINDSLNSHWRYVGSYDDVKKLNINKINCGNLTSVNFKATSCGHFYYAEVIEESFGQKTIPELITDKDKKQANTFEF